MADGLNTDKFPGLHGSFENGRISTKENEEATAQNLQDLVPNQYTCHPIQEDSSISRCLSPEPDLIIYDSRAIYSLAPLHPCSGLAPILQPEAEMRFG